MIVRGYHGTTEAVGAKITTDGFFDSDRSGRAGLWLGAGSYFFMDAPLRAFSWARKWKCKAGEQAIVLECDIDLSEAVDLLDEMYWDLLWQLYDTHEDEIDEASRQVLRATRRRDQVSIVEHLEDVRLKRDNRYTGWNVKDCVLFNLFCSHLLDQGVDVTAIRCAVGEGALLHHSSWFWDQSAVMICVKRPRIIKIKRAIDTWP